MCVCGARAGQRDVSRDVRITVVHSSQKEHELLPLASALTTASHLQLAAGVSSTRAALTHRLFTERSVRPPTPHTAWPRSTSSSCTLYPAICALRCARPRWPQRPRALAAARRAPSRPGRPGRLLRHRGRSGGASRHSSDAHGSPGPRRGLGAALRGPCGALAANSRRCANFCRR